MIGKEKRHTELNVGTLFGVEIWLYRPLRESQMLEHMM